MKFARLIALLACAALAWGCLERDVQAQSLGCYGTGGFAHPGFFGYAGSPYSLGQIPTPPYFAIHPPVYYSQPVPRTYGYSPFAYPGTMQTPEIVEPEIIENPHVTQPAQEEPAANVKVVRFQVIHNPYVRDELKDPSAPQLAAVKAVR
jgi:hypothetical protein